MTVSAVAVVAVAATTAFFSDTETSSENILQAGAIDLQIDSEAHYAGLVCTPEGVWEVENTDLGTTRPELVGEPCDGTWDSTDLTEERFFNLTDLKPGDEGENTISLHVFDNDAWGRLIISNVLDEDVDCTEPESEDLDDPECSSTSIPAEGELQDNLEFSIWLDQGLTLGFQNSDQETENDDPEEGDNIQQQGEPTLVSTGPLDVGGETLDIWVGLGLYRLSLGTACDLTDLDGDGHATSNGTYLECHGLATDGRLVGSVNYYFGLAWELPEDTGNEAQGDRLTADLSFEVEQQRNNPIPFGP